MGALRARRPHPGCHIVRVLTALVFTGALLSLWTVAEGVVVSDLAELNELMRSECLGGNLSLAAQCNHTAYSFESGCLSSVVTEECELPIFGSQCIQLIASVNGIENQNVTCMSPIICGRAPTIGNAETSYSSGDEGRFGDTTTIRCTTGYERSDAKGYSATIECSENGFSALPADFGCSPVSCGLYCRTCAGAYTARGSVGSEGDGRPTSGERLLHPYTDAVG